MSPIVALAGASHRAAAACYALARALGGADGEIAEHGEISVDLTPGVVWTDGQLDVVKQLTAKLTRVRVVLVGIREESAASQDDYALGMDEAHYRISQALNGEAS
jgi:hypothetical protein